LGWWSPEQYVEQNGGPYPASRYLDISFGLDQDALCLTWFNGSGNLLGIKESLSGLMGTWRWLKVKWGEGNYQGVKESS